MSTRRGGWRSTEYESPPLSHARTMIKLAGATYIVNRWQMRDIFFSVYFFLEDAISRRQRGAESIDSPSDATQKASRVAGLGLLKGPELWAVRRMHNSNNNNNSSSYYYYNRVGY